MPEPFFHVDGDEFLPTVLCQGPWDPGRARGGPPSALRMTPGEGALASGVLYDTIGRIGQSEQSLHVGPRAPA